MQGRVGFSVSALCSAWTSLGSKHHMFSYNQEFSALRNRRGREQRCEEEEDRQERNSDVESREPQRENQKRRRMGLRGGSAGEVLEFGSRAV